MNEMNDGLPQIDQPPVQGNAQVPDDLPDQTQVQDDAHASDLPQESGLSQEASEQVRAESQQDNGQPLHSYQFFPTLLHDDEQALRKSISEVGVLTPIVRDEEGNIIEGHQRKRIADELGIDCPEVVRKFGSEQEKCQFALMVNCARRHLTTTQKREVIAAYLMKDPEISNNWLGEILGVSANTVLDEREELESTSQIARLDKLRGKDNKKRTAKTRRKNVKRAQKQNALPAGDISGAEAQEEPQVIPFASEDDPQVPAVENVNTELTAEEYQAVIDFVTAVGGWTRAKLVMEKGERKWKENQEG